MSKLAMIQQYQYSPYAGGLISWLGKAGKFIGKKLGLVKKVTQQVVPTVLPAAKKIGKMVAPAAAYVAADIAAESLLGGGGGAGASGGWTKRRARGITARELRGYRKVANLLHKEGMVSRRARGRK